MEEHVAGQTHEMNEAGWKLDQGQGFDEAQLTRSSSAIHGLLSIRHRLHLLGCRFNVKSQPGQGTTAIIEIPLERMDS
jgi:signal transduction histidine kinase